MKRIFALTAVVVGALALYMQWPLESENTAPTELAHETSSALPSKPSAEKKDSKLISTVEPTSTSASDESRAQEKLKILTDILKSKNDNDPRLDTDFATLNETDKIMLRKYYSDLAVEDRNARGTVVFLLSKSIQSPADLDFFKEVLKEEPCLSLADCNSKIGEGDPHHSDTDDVSKNYPQMVALNRIENWLQSVVARQTSREVIRTTEDVLRAGMDSPVPIVSNKAKQVFELFQKKFR